jgi:hypothetical protein
VNISLCDNPLRFLIRNQKYRISRPIRRTTIFSLEILEKNDDECILILITFWKKTGLVHILLQESCSQAVMPDLMIWKQISLSHDKDVVQ